MMRLLFTIRPDDGDPFELTADSRDVLKWEDAKPGRKAADLLSGSYGMRDLYGLAFAAAKRQGLVEGTEKDFIAAHAVESGHNLADDRADDQAEGEDEDDDAVPTRPAR